MAELAIIIGNGFDIDLGLPSKYSQFIEGDEWKKIVDKIILSSNSDYRKHSLLYHLYKEANCDSKKNWFNIEEEIKQFIHKHTKCSQDEVDDIKREFDTLQKALKEYLIRVSCKCKMDIEKYPYMFINKLVNCHKKIVVFNFNYTNPIIFLPTQNCCPQFLKNQISLHGNLDGNRIILGCNEQEKKYYNSSLSFMYKQNMLNNTNNITQSLLDAKDVVFYGHSINDMDFCYFKDFFNYVSTGNKNNKNITIITLDEDSERTIRDNIYNQGISVSDLYDKPNLFEFIHTKKLNDQDNEELQKWVNMLERISRRNIRGIRRIN
jgi:hypothetical protein